MAPANHEPEQQARTFLRLGVSRPLLRLIPAIFLFIPALPAGGQVFQVNGGTSSLFEATGGSIEAHASNYDGGAGVGSLDGRLTVGAFLRTEWRGTKFSFGDDTIPFRLPTDIFNDGHYFLGRGIGVTRAVEEGSVFGFVGTTSRGFGVPFFTGARSENAAGILFMNAKLSSTLELFSRNIVSVRQTSISGLEWHPRQGVKASLGGGVGANQAYAGSNLEVDRQWISVKGAYVLAGNQFRRIVVQTPLNSETDRENVLVTLRPSSFFDLGVGRFNFLQPLNPTGPELRATVNQYTASARAAHFTLSSSLFDSRARGIRNIGTSVLLGRDFGGRIQASANLLHSRSSREPSVTSLVGTLREVISPRLSLLQLVNQSNGRTSFSLGGDFLSNPVSIGIEYQTIYAPFRTGNPFRQALVLNLRLQPRGSLQVNAATLVAPDGSVKYTAYGSDFAYRGESAPGASSTFKFPKFVVSGRVIDENGRPVGGAALDVDGEMVFTNSEGAFFARLKKSRPCRLEVQLNEFLVPGRFEVVSCPTMVTPSAEGQEVAVVIVLRRGTEGP